VVVVVVMVVVGGRWCQESSFRPRLIKNHEDRESEKMRMLVSSTRRTHSHKLLPKHVHLLSQGNEADVLGAATGDQRCLLLSQRAL
jgi:hypothetical protein